MSDNKWTTMLKDENVNTDTFDETIRHLEITVEARYNDNFYNDKSPL